MAASLNFGAFAKATELKKRIWFTIGALIVFRLGTYIPLPGIDPMIMADIFRQQSGGILGMFNVFAGGALARMTIFALNIMPYISASIIVQLLTAVRSEEHTSELQSLMRISYAVFCLKKKKKQTHRYYRTKQTT